MHRKISLGSDKLGLSMLFFIFNMKFSNNKLFEKLLGKFGHKLLKVDIYESKLQFCYLSQNMSLDCLLIPVFCMCCKPEIVLLDH